VAEVLLSQFGVINNITLLLDGESGGISACQPLRPFRLYFHQVPCRGEAQDHLTAWHSKLAKPPEIFSPEIVAGYMGQTASPRCGQQIAVSVVRRQREVPHDLRRLPFASVYEDYRSAATCFLLAHFPRDVAPVSVRLPGDRPRELILG